MKEKKKMTISGVGPVYVLSILIISLILLYMSEKGLMPVYENSKMDIFMHILGFMFIIGGCVLHFCAAVVSNIVKGVKQQKLLTEGVYSYVRNPIYCGHAFSFIGLSCFQKNLLLCIIYPIIYWVSITILIRKEEKILEEVFGEEYIIYKSKVNRFIPWKKLK